MTRALVVNAPSHKPGEVLNKLGRWIPGEQLGLCYLAAVLRRVGHHVELCDAFMLGMSADEVADMVLSRAGEFDLVGLSVSDGKVHGCARVLELLAGLDGSVHLTLGGHTATLCDSEFLERYPRLDSVVRGEGEIPVVALCDALDRGEPWTGVAGLSHRSEDGQVVANPMPTLTHDLDELPFPARDNLRLCLDSGFAVSIETSRGCKGVCSFCATRMMYQPSTGRVWRPRSVGHVLAEVETLVRDHGVRRIAFEDEDFLGFGSERGFQRATELAEEILRRGLDFEFAMLTRVDNVDRDLFALLQRAGLRFVFIGAESGSQRALNSYRKETTVEDNIRAVRILRDLGIEHEILWIMYDPDTTMADVEANVAFLDHVDALNVNLLNRMRVYHGTPMHARMSRQRRLTGDFLEYDYDFRDRRVTAFERAASQGLNAFYQVINRADVLKWEVGDGHGLGRAVSTVTERVHLHAVAWLRELVDAVNADRPLDDLQDRAVAAATDDARLLARIVAAWPVADTTGAPT